MRKIVMVSFLAVLFVSGISFACESDTDCRSNRICEDEKCVNPPVQSHEEDADIGTDSGSSIPGGGSSIPGGGGSIPGGGGSIPGGGGGIPSGGAIAPCGCWGPVMPGAQQSAPLCQSGVASAIGCPGTFCPPGGIQWHFICN